MKLSSSKVSKDAKIGNRYNQVPNLTLDTNGKVTKSQLDTTNESQEVSPFPAGDHKAQINRQAQSRARKLYTSARIYEWKFGKGEWKLPFASPTGRADFFGFVIIFEEKKN